MLVSNQRTTIKQQKSDQTCTQANIMVNVSSDNSQGGGQVLVEPL